jgi:hypothetical protein
MSVDQDIQDIRSQLAKDPFDFEAQVKLLQLRSKVEGESIYFEPLNDRLVWNQTPEVVQDVVIKKVEDTLGSSFSHEKTKHYSCGGVSHRIATFSFLLGKRRKKRTGVSRLFGRYAIFDNDVFIELNLIPGGQFQMGSNDFLHEQPIHEVQIRSPFLMSVFPVTQLVWDSLNGNDERTHFEEALPIDKISYSDIRLWLNELSEGFRIPSESEWEFSCRSGTQTKYFWGDTEDLSFCWTFENASHDPMPVLQHQNKTNAFGLVDMIGNINEYCEDGWIKNFRDGPVDESPRHSDNLKNVGRGGMIALGISDISCSTRHFVDHRYRMPGTGFRLARSII